MISALWEIVLIVHCVTRYFSGFISSNFPSFRQFLIGCYRSIHCILWWVTNIFVGLKIWICLDNCKKAWKLNSHKINCNSFIFLYNCLIQVILTFGYIWCTKELDPVLRSKWNLVSPKRYCTMMNYFGLFLNFTLEFLKFASHFTAKVELNKHFTYIKVNYTF